jgi:transposase
MQLQRLCRELARLVGQSTAIKNRLLAIDGYAWLGLRDILPPHGPAARWLRSHWYSPWRVLQAGVEPIAQAWKAHNPDHRGPLDWIPGLIQKAQRVTALYSDPLRIDYEHLQASVAREQTRLQQLEGEQRHLRIKVLRPLYRKLHPQRYLETLPGVGQDSAAVYIGFIGDIRRFPSLCRFRGWSGLVPASSQSGQAQAKGLHITQAGQDLVKSTAFLNAGVSRLYDPQIAAIYYDQMMAKGKHHLQAICACATHLLNRIYAVLRQNRPYQLRDRDGTPVSKKLARAICKQCYQVPEEVRRHNNYRVRRAWAEQRLEQRRRRKQQRRRSKG